MYGHGVNHHQLKRFTREKIPGFFVAFRRYGASPGVMDVPALWGVPRRYGRSGVVGGVPRRYGASPRRYGRSPALWGVPTALWTFPGVMVGDRNRATGTGRQGTGYIHALCGNCKENLAKTRLKTEISRYLRKFLLKNLHKAKICRTFASSKRKTKTQTNMEKTNFFMEHYFYLKKMYPADEILLFRCGDFYEAYMEEAEKIANVLGITLTRSSIHKEEDGSGLRIASFPYYNLEKYGPKLRDSDIHISVEDSLYY